MPDFHDVHILLRNFVTRHLSHFDRKWLFFPIWDFFRTFWGLHRKWPFCPIYKILKTLWNYSPKMSVNHDYQKNSNFFKIFGIIFPENDCFALIFGIFFSKTFELFHQKCRLCLIFKFFWSFSKFSPKICVFMMCKIFELISFLTKNASYPQVSQNFIFCIFSLKIDVTSDFQSISIFRVFFIFFCFLTFAPKITVCLIF